MLIFEDDIISLLPPEAAAKLRAFRRDADDSAAVVRNIVSQTLEARERRQAAERRMREVTRPRSGKAAGEGHPGYEAAKAALDQAGLELAELANREAAASAVWTLRAGLVRNIERALQDQASRGLAFKMAPEVEPRLARGEDTIAGIERNRRELRRLTADLHAVRSAPLLASEARAAMIAQINALAEVGRPHVSPAIEHGEPIEFATVQMRTLARGETVAHVGWEQFDGLSTFAWLHRDALIKRLAAEIDSEVDDSASLSAADRKRRESELLGDIGATNRQIAALSALAESQGITVEHDADVEPEIALGIVAIEPPAQPSGFDIAADILRRAGAVAKAGA